MYNIRFLLLIFFCYAQALSAYLLNNDQEAHEYCLNHNNSFIGIVWPIAQGKDDEIKNTIEQFGKILYEKQYFFSYEQAYFLLSTAHRKIEDLDAHVFWYFPPGAFREPARIFVLEFEQENAPHDCKHAVRRLFPYQYRSMHINDTHEETLQLADFFFNTI